MIILETNASALVDEEAFVSERISALNISLLPANSVAQTLEEEEEVEIDNFSKVNR